MMYSMSDTCSCDPCNFFLSFFGGAICMEQNANWLSKNETTMTAAVAIRVAKHAEMRK